MRNFMPRRAVAAAALAAFMGAVAAPSIATAQDDSVTFLGIWPFSGPYADLGPILNSGAEVAFENVGGEIAGKTINYITRDSETEAGAATRRAQAAIETDGVQYMIGPWSSGVALALTEVSKNNKVPYFFSGGSEDISGKKCHRYAFQWAANAWTAMDANLKAFKELHPDAKSIYLFVVDYAFGWSLQKYVEELAPKYGLEVVGADRHPLGNREFSTFITKAMAANPDAVFMINFGLDAISAVRQLNNFGFAPAKPVIMSWSSGVEELVQLDPAMRENLIVGTNYYWTIDNPENKDFVEKYKAKNDGVPPGYGPAAGYGLASMFLAGMEKAGSTEPQAVVEALEGMEGDNFVGHFKIDAKTHQTVRPYFVLKTKPESEMENEYDFGEIVLTSDTPQPAEMNGCADIGGF